MGSGRNDRKRIHRRSKCFASVDAAVESAENVRDLEIKLWAKFGGKWSIRRVVRCDAWIKLPSVDTPDSDTNRAVVAWLKEREATLLAGKQTGA